MCELVEFHKRLKEMSPIPQKKDIDSPDKVSPDRYYGRTRNFKIEAVKDYPRID